MRHSHRILRGMKRDAQNTFFEYSDQERRVDRAVHLVGVAASIVACAALIVFSALWQDTKTTASIAIYAFSTIALFLTSAAYHMVQAPALKAKLRRLDHAAIFLKIAGTYTPFAWIIIGGVQGGWLMVAVWSIAIIGIILKLGGWQSGAKLPAALYLAQGWLILLALDLFRAALQPAELILCLVGGLLYTVGVAFFLAVRLPHHNAIWHLFVLMASACFYAAILKAVVLR